MLRQILLEFLFISAENGGLVHDVRWQEGLYQLVHEVRERSQTVADQFVLPIRKELFGAVCHIFSKGKLEILSPKGTIICYKDEIIDVAFGVILYEDVQHV